MIGWLLESGKPYLTIGGYAGTGKTTLMTVWRKLLKKIKPKIKVAFCAYTGKASLGILGALRHNRAWYETDSVSTIHALIYTPITDQAGQIVGFKRKTSLDTDLIVIDEASMVDREIFQDLLTYGKPVIAVGDHGQLPPIASDQFNLMAKPELTLETIMRQAAGSPIIQVSILARETGVIPIKDFGRGVTKIDRYASESAEMVESILRKIEKTTMVVVGLNLTRVRLNQAVRSFLERGEDQPARGDRVICLKNNWNKGLFNGQVGTIERIIPLIDKGECQGFEAEILMDGESIPFVGRVAADHFNRLAGSDQFGKKLRKRDEMGEWFDYGYAVTVHKAQGSQAEKVLLFEERNQHMSDDDWRRWLYTGVTRAEKKLVIVGS